VERLRKFLEENEDLDFEASSSSIAASYFVRIAKSETKQTHLCVLCEILLT